MCFNFLNSTFFLLININDKFSKSIWERKNNSLSIETYIFSVCLNTSLNVEFKSRGGPREVWYWRIEKGLGREGRVVTVEREKEDNQLIILECSVVWVLVWHVRLWILLHLKMLTNSKIDFIHFFLRHLWDWAAGETSLSQWHCKLQPEPKYNLPAFTKITKNVWQNWFHLLKEGEEKKINPVLKHSLWEFSRKTAYWVDPDLDTLIFGSWPCQSQTRAHWLWIKLFDSSAHRHTKPALSQLLHKSLWNPRMVFVNSAAMRTVPTCQKLTLGV